MWNSCQRWIYRRKNNTLNKCWRNITLKSVTGIRSIKRKRKVIRKCNLEKIKRKRSFNERVIVRSLKIAQQQQQGQQQQAHPLVAAVIQMWPMFERVASKIVSSAKVTEPLEIMVSKYNKRRCSAKCSL